MVTTRLHPFFVLAAASCYEPSPPNGVLLCSLDGQCPEGYRCASDHTCWRTGASTLTEAPLLISPRNGVSTGTVHAALARRPLFRWRDMPGAISYEIQLDDSCDVTAFRSCTFPSPEASEIANASSHRLSSGLTVSSVSTPVGRRYYWRVRACGDSRCTPWSDVRYLDVGRNSTDFTGDGDSDLAIGNAGASVNGTTGVGAAYIAIGTQYFVPGLRTLTPLDGAFGMHYGIAAASAGDLDADGIADLVVSDEGMSQSGRVHLYRGGTNWSSNTPSLTLLNPEGQTVAYFGHALVGGDLNGDGHSDLVVGAEIQDGTAFGEGKVFVYAGKSSSPGIPATPTWTLENPAHQEQGKFGNALAIGDFDGDGYADLAVAAINQDALGRVFLYHGGPTGLASSPVATLDDPVIVTGVQFGHALAAGDFDGDGYADLAVGAPEEQVGTVLAVGRVYIFHGGLGGIADRAVPWITLNNPTGQMYSRYGSVLTAADFNADDTDDLVVSATYQDTAAGRVYVYAGTPAGLPSDPSKTLNDPNPVSANDFFGYVLATGDRAPGDGLADLFVGAPRSAGVIYIFDGTSSGLPETTENTITGATVPGGDLGPLSLSSAPP